MSSLPQAWKQWVLDSLLSGSDGMSILKVLLQNGFTFEAAKKALGNNLPEGIACNKDEAFYARLAHPKLLDNLAQYDGQVIEQERAQLLRIDHFLSPQECDYLVMLTKQHLRPSELPKREGDTYKGYRTSSTCDLPYTGDNAAKQVDQKIIDTLGLGLGEREVIQAQHYAIGQEFKSHYDYFVPGSDDYKVYSRQGGQRTWTFMIYLNDECEGGKTEFLRLGKSFAPKQGTAIIWNNLLPDGSPNPNTLHQAHPITSGEKIVITKWFREDAYEPLSKKLV